MTKKMNLSIKRKPLITASVGILFIFILSFGYLLWTQQVIQLTVADIEILSIEVEHNPSIQQINTDTNEQITLPEDVSYTIKYKIIRPFTDEITGYSLDKIRIPCTWISVERIPYSFLKKNRYFRYLLMLKYMVKMR